MLIAHPLTLASTITAPGPAGRLALPPSPRRAVHGAWQAALLALALAAIGTAVRLSQAGGATGSGSRCDAQDECPPALACVDGKCAP